MQWDRPWCQLFWNSLCSRLCHSVCSSCSSLAALPPPGFSFCFIVFQSWAQLGCHCFKSTQNIVRVMFMYTEYWWNGRWLQFQFLMIHRYMYQLWRVHNYSGVPLQWCIVQILKILLALFRGPWGRDPLNTLDHWSGTLFLSLSGICLHSLLFSRNWNLFTSAYWSFSSQGLGIERVQTSSIMTMLFCRWLL